MYDQLIDNLSARERKRRQALWQMLDPLKQQQALKELDVIEQLDIVHPIGEASNWTLSKLSEHVPLYYQTYGKGSLALIKIDSIPEPWRTRMGAASRGSTRYRDGYFSEDWENFLKLWEREHEELKRLRVRLSLISKENSEAN